MSTSERADSRAGIEAQRAAVEAGSERRGWTELRFIEDAGHSGKSTKRPGLGIALESLKRGDAAGLVASKMDRLSRSLMDFVHIMDVAQRQAGRRSRSTARSTLRRPRARRWRASWRPPPSSSAA